MNRIEGKIALVTGGASGMGEAIAKRFAVEGARVIVADRDERRGTAVVREIGAAARFVSMDVSKPENWTSLDKDIRATEGRLDILVNCAGIVKWGSIEDNSFEDLMSTQAVNSDAVFIGCKFAVAIMKETSKAGSIVNILSTSSVRPNHRAAAYCASKGAALNTTRVVALHCAEQGYPIRCNSILPGVIETPMLDGVFSGASDPAEVRRGLLARLPMGRLGRTDEVASATLFLASDEASYITGTSLAVDGGCTAA